MLYQPLTPAGWVALLAVTIVGGAIGSVFGLVPYGLLGAGLTFYLASTVVRVWESRRIRRDAEKR